MSNLKHMAYHELCEEERRCKIQIYQAMGRLNKLKTHKRYNDRNSWQYHDASTLKRKIGGQRVRLEWIQEYQKRHLEKLEGSE